ncbi:MAG TPA: flagellar basal body P-ring formation chaperone FlgA [Vicinamibacterales bacterium]|jgi:flagella basal body P-ring formation protein FlgA|nr:flagellar basal body P-ring formation chaperone FlgA [Vicinamibacterales bacterium]
MTRLSRVAAAIGFAAACCAAAPAVRASDPSAPRLAPAADVIRAAIVSRLGVDADVTIDAIDLPDRPGLPAVFRDARPDPGAFLGRPIRFVLVPELGPTVIAIATVHVVAEHIVAARALDRNETLSDDAMRVVRDELKGAPLRRVLSASQVRGGRVLRPIPAGAVVVPGAVIARRAIEPGDRVTVRAISGDIEVSASLVAADAGNPGDVIRVVNPDTHRDLRGRVIKAGLVEVAYAR